MKKRFDRRFFVVSIPTLAFLGLFGGFYLMIRVKSGIFPWSNYIFERGTPTTVQFLTMNFHDIELMLAYLVMAVGLAIAFQIIDDKLLNRQSWVTPAFALTILLSSIYFVNKLIPIVSFDNEYLEIYFSELKDEMMIFVVMSLLFFSILTGLLRSIGVPRQRSQQRP